MDSQLYTRHCLSVYWSWFVVEFDVCAILLYSDTCHPALYDCELEWEEAGQWPQRRQSPIEHRRTLICPSIRLVWSLQGQIWGLRALKYAFNGLNQSSKAWNLPLQDVRKITPVFYRAFCGPCFAIIHFFIGSLQAGHQVPWMTSYFSERLTGRQTQN